LNSASRSRTCLAFLTPATLLLLLLGCAQPRYQAAPLEDIRDHVGAVLVTSAELAPIPRFEGYARGRLSGAGRGALIGMGAVMQGGGGGGPLILLFLPPAALLGATGGAIAADPEKLIKKSEEEAREALADLQVQRALQQRTVEMIGRQAPHVAVRQAAEGMPAPDGSRIADQGETILEVALLNIGSRGVDINTVVLFMTAEARLSRMSDGILLFSEHYRFASERRKFSSWCADDAALLRQAYSRGLDHLAGEIVDDIFLTLPREEAGQLQIIEPAGRFGRQRIDTLQPTFTWQIFPSSDGQTWLRGRPVEAVTYELRINRLDGADLAERVVEIEGISAPAYTLEAPLAPQTKYQWMVRARLAMPEGARVTRWSSPVIFKTP
jgi:hypothetical protein